MQNTNIEKLNRQINTLVKNVKGEDTFVNQKKSVTYSEFLSNKMLLVLTIRKGIPYSLFASIKSLAPFSENEWAGLLEISSKTLQRYKKSSKNFKSAQSEKIIELAEVANLGSEVFGNMEKFKLWLETPNFSLGKLKPIELLKDSYGKEMVLGELTRINYGILA
ncbi:MAG: antitoxin Xre-like helix-turn-helix domain-containing protein [Bacteroidota bacterium]